MIWITGWGYNKKRCIFLCLFIRWFLTFYHGKSPIFFTIFFGTYFIFFPTTLRSKSKVHEIPRFMWKKSMASNSWRRVFCWLFSMERDMGSLVLLRDSVCLSLNLPPKFCRLNSESEVTIILMANCVSWSSSQEDIWMILAFGSPGYPLLNAPFCQTSGQDEFSDRNQFENNHRCLLPSDDFVRERKRRKEPQNKAPS